MKVSVKIDPQEVEGDFDYVDGLCLTCVSSARGAYMLREECPNGESNYYDAYWWAG